MTIPRDVTSDLASFRSHWLQRMRPGHQLLRTAPVRALLDIAVDWCVILTSVFLVTRFGVLLAPVAIVLIGNRQRALGNILHDAGHRNLSRSARINDGIANALVAPLLLTSLARYRAAHFAHHLSLGDAQRDPDFMAVPAPPALSWAVRYMHAVLSTRSWIGSIAGHIMDASLPQVAKLRMLCWWVALLASLAFVADSAFALAFVGLWFGARATVFHLITTFREMCDHVGLQPGGIFSFTRDVTCRSPWRWLIHPRNNGYHLTHHLCPAVPYHRLPQAHRLFRELPAYRQRAVECDAYFLGANPVVRAWSGAPAS